MAKPTVKTAERLRDMRTKGVEQTMPGTGRVVRLKSVDPTVVLREGKMPDTLTPLLVSAIYQEPTTGHLNQYLQADRGTVEAALAMADSIDFIVKKALADDTKVEDLTMAEKRWIFQLVLGPAEILTNFRLEQDPDVEAVAEGENV